MSKRGTDIPTIVKALFDEAYAEGKDAPTEGDLISAFVDFESNVINHYGNKDAYEEHLRAEQASIDPYSLNREHRIDKMNQRLTEAMNLLDYADGLIAKHETLGTPETMWRDQYRHWKEGK